MYFYLSTIKFQPNKYLHFFKQNSFGKNIQSYQINFDLFTLVKIRKVSHKNVLRDDFPPSVTETQKQVFNLYFFFNYPFYPNFLIVYKKKLAV